MKQDLWAVNSSLLAMIALSFGLYEAVQQDVPALRASRDMGADEQEQEKKVDQVAVAKAWEKIYQEDIFGTYIPKEIKPVKQNFVTPIPEPRAFTPPPPPEQRKQDFIAPLTLSIRGIIAGSDESRNVAMIADETSKEDLFHVGDKVKDAQIIKIASNRVILLRANGQQETFYLRKDDVVDPKIPGDKWKGIVQRIDDQTYEIDPQEFVKEVESLGNFIERAGVVGAAYRGGAIIGLRIGNVAACDLPPILGLQENDIMVSVNGINVAVADNRIKAYESILQTQIGGAINVGLMRAEKNISITYKLVKMKKFGKQPFAGIKVALPQEQFKTNRVQQREQTRRDFDKLHVNDQKQQESVMEIRRRILENMQRRIGPQ